MIAAEGRWQEAINQAAVEEIKAQNRVVQARNNVLQAQTNLDSLENGPTTADLVQAEVAVDRALVAYEKAARDLENAQLYAPFDGVVMDIAVDVGDQLDDDDQVGANTVILTLATLQEPLVRFWVEEGDYGSVVVGNSVTLVFEALPDDVFSGEIIQVDPVLVSVNATSAVQVWASVEIDSETTLFSGMTVEVEVVAAEARNVLLVPVGALQIQGENEYAVFVVGSDDELALRPIEVGLMDFTNAEVVSGLELGDVVSLGETE
jgi:RND family efflux transporter MFP subunit